MLRIAHSDTPTQAGFEFHGPAVRTAVGGPATCRSCDAGDGHTARHLVTPEPGKPGPALEPPSPATTPRKPAGGAADRNVI